MEVSLARTCVMPGQFRGPAAPGPQSLLPLPAAVPVELGCEPPGREFCDPRRRRQRRQVWKRTQIKAIFRFLERVLT
jgi:hypothetical protein